MPNGETSFGRLRPDLARRELRSDEAAVRLGSRALDISVYSLRPEAEPSAKTS
jgi:hypothetical protein